MLFFKVSLFPCNFFGFNPQCQITQSDINEETQSTYEEAHVLVSADNYNKIDAAVALLELLFTPASVSSTFSVEL